MDGRTDGRRAETGRFRRGDVLMVECPFVEAAVTGVRRDHVSLRWPWWEVDPEAEGVSWNGDVALPTPEDRDWERSFFRTEPPPGALEAGGTCLVGIPPTVVHVVAVHRFEPPLVTGWLPRPACYLDVLRQGETHDPEREYQAYELDPAGGEPIRLRLLFRPFAFLEPGDEVADRAGRAWRFDAAWDWHAFDGERSAVPAWPLALLTRGAGAPRVEEAAAVARATAVGGHAEEVERWSGLALAEPVALGP
ncbi:hypothetical protein [Kitasatospora sp. NPDC089509]|uniref:hypothetical protein n=1 Tax=Kitasatospora sp. NPDC089509 TaxID=3364079 RepID=UPI003819613E